MMTQKQRSRGSVERGTSGLLVPFFRSVRRGGAGLLLVPALLLAGCAAPAPPARPKSGAVPDGTYLSGAACIIDMNYRGVAFNRAPDSAKVGECGVETAVAMTESPWTPLDKPVAVDCTLARQVAIWDETVVRPAAQRHFGQNVAMIQHYGGYVCRGRTSNHSRLSEHAFGKAIDIGGFKLADGTRISVEKDWRDGGAKAEFLREVAQGACSLFSVVLTPNSDADHANHLHLDTGPWKLCSL